MPIAPRIRFEVLLRDGNACTYCGAKPPDAELSIDHVIPITLGGSDEPRNLVTACMACNLGKNSRFPGTPLPELVSAMAIQWSAAMQLVAEERAASREAHSVACAHLFEHWESTRTSRQRTSDLSPNFDTLICHFLAAGLDIRELEEAMTITLANPSVANKWKYFHGWCWEIVRRSQERAVRIIEAPEIGGR